MKKIISILDTLFHDPDSPVWLDGFENVLVYGQTSSEDDNPYEPTHEPGCHKEYKAGALAAESLLSYMRKPRCYFRCDQCGKHSNTGEANHA